MNMSMGSVRAGLLTLLLGALGLGGISGCVTPVVAPPQPSTAAAQLTEWSFQGRLAIDDGRQSWQSSIIWQQRGDDYRIDLIGPLGQGQMVIYGGPGGVSLRSGEQWLHADDADTLLVEATGFTLPVSGLRYWLLGLAMPTLPVRTVSDAEGRVRQLQQAEWSIDYPNYLQVEAFSLPQRVRAVHEPFTVQLLVNQWTLI